MKSNTLISVVINCHNGEKYLKEAINSVYNQTYTNWEIIFFDNASCDDTGKIAQSYNSKLRYIKNNTLVPLYSARNLAVKHCNGEAVAFLDCDDYWDKTKLEKQVKLYEQTNAIICSYYYTIDDKGKILSMQKHDPLSGNITNALFKKNFISIGSVLISKVILEDNHFEESLDLLGDFDLWLRLSKIYKYYAVTEALEYSRIHNNNLSDTKRKQWLSERRKVYMKYLTFKNIILYPYLSIYIFKTEIKGLISLR